MGLTLSEFYKKLKYDLDHYEEAYTDYRRLQFLLYFVPFIMVLLGFALGFFVVKMRYL